MFLDAELSGALTSQIKAHLDRCAVCSKELAILKKSWALLDNLEDIEPSPDFSNRFYKRLAEKESRREVRVFGFPKPALNWAPALVTAVILLFFINIYLNVRTYSVKKAQFVVSGGGSSETNEEKEIIENLELLEYLEMFEDLDILEAQEGLESTGSLSSGA